MQEIVIRSKSGKPLNEVTAYLVSEKAELLERMETVEFIEGAATLAGSGDTPVLEIRLVYTTIREEDLEDIEEILTRGFATADDVEIIRREVEDEPD